MLLLDTSCCSLYEYSGKVQLEGADQSMSSQEIVVVKLGQSVDLSLSDRRHREDIFNIPSSSHWSYFRHVSCESSSIIVAVSSPLGM
jgi:hypothetical protein